MDNKPSSFGNPDKNEYLRAEEPSAGSANKEPSAGSANKEPSADSANKEPSAGLTDKEPSAGLINKEPSADINEEMSSAGLIDEEASEASVASDEDEPVSHVEIEAAYWFKKMSDVDIADEDYRALKKWLAQDEAHQVVYAELMELWDNPYFELALREKKAALEKVDLDARFGRKSAVASEQPAQVASRSVNFGRWPLHVAIYTGLAASALFAAFTWVTDVGDPAAEQRILYQTSVGEQRRVMLTDGSTVNINTDTQLHVAIDQDARKVTLTRGEAYFDVVKDGRPFLVEGGTGLVKVLGTAFEVRVNPEQMLVFVERGKVAVSPKNDETQRLEVTPRLQLAVTHSRLGKVKYQGASNTVADWRDGWLEFRDEALADVVAELDKYYGGSISLDKNKLSHLRVSGRYNIQDIRMSIKILAKSMRLDMVTSNNGNIELLAADNKKINAEG